MTTSSESLPLNISVPQVMELYQKLLDLMNDSCNDNDATIPSDIQKNLNKIHAAQKDLITSLDAFMHKRKRNISEVTVVKTIAQTCPEFLSSEDEKGHIPIHVAAFSKRTAATFVPLLAKIGVEHRVGGGDAKGGLLINNVDWDNPLQILSCKGSTDALKALSKCNEELLSKEDAVEELLLHHAVWKDKIETVKWLANMAPAALFKRDGAGYLPIGTCDSNEVFKFLLKRAIGFDPDHTSIGGLFSKCYDDGGDRIIEHANLAFPSTLRNVAFKSIGQVLSQYPNIPILHKAIELTPGYVLEFMTNCPHSCFVRDKSGRLSIHIALATGMEWSIALVAIINANHEHLGALDPVTHLCPSALAAMEPSCELNTIYHLLRKHPEHVEVCISKKRILSSKENKKDGIMIKKKRKATN